MPNRSTDALFQLIKSLHKAEKRHFKLYIKRATAKENLKIVELFDTLDKLDDYEERELLKKLPSIKKPQLNNIKSHLYKQLLASLRDLKSTDTLELQLSEQLDNARILYHKGLKHQAMRILERAKELATANGKFNYLAQVISLEKKIETLHITRTIQEKTEKLTQEALEISGHIDRVTRLSNLALRLYGWYVMHGHARNEKDETGIRQFFKEQLPSDAFELTDFYEKLYLYQSYTWYAFIRQDFLMYYRYSKKWVDLFYEQEVMQKVEIGHFIKGLHNLLNAHFDLRNYQQFQVVLKQFEEFAKTPIAQQHDNFRIHTDIYINSARLNWHLMTGTFKEGLGLVNTMAENLKEYELYVDPHRIVVFYYKFATLYFGSGDYNTCIDYLQKIINDTSANLRIDLQSYARLMHMMAHYELGNDDIMESQIKSVYRFMAKMKNLTVVEEEMFRFIRHSFGLSPRKLKPELEKFLQKIKHLEKNRFETRAFAYLDIISWVESKVFEKPMNQVINEKYLASRKRRY
ncbi:hypothetical protein HY58_00360 [Flavihumibacter sp. ZG627]|nr:hypothetical protein [Flavihumibacter sp. ZG627]KIC92064.1 hypothetical protein HY58_00360 [Flavihumibacter sp. ZG627]